MHTFRIDPEAIFVAARDMSMGAVRAATNTDNGNPNGFNATAQQMLIGELRFAAARSIRVSTIVLAAFNAVAAFATACGILYDGYSRKKRERRRLRASTMTRRRALSVQSSEVYPLVLSCGIAIQGIGFSVAQAQGLNTLLSTGCTVVALFMLPAVFIAPYIQLIFGVEFAIRGARKKPFPERRKYNTTICLVILGMLLLITYLVADFVRAPDFCFASLFWFVAPYSRGCFAALLAITILLVASVAVIFVRLTQSIEIDTRERTSASQMVYYLSIGIISNVLMMPFFFVLGFQKQQQMQGLTLSMVASVVANVSGLLTGGLHLFLRSKAISAIGPRDKAGEYERRRMENRSFSPSSGSDQPGHMMRPIDNDDLRRMLSDASLISGTAYESKADEIDALDKQDAVSLYDAAASSTRPNPLRSNVFYSTAAGAAVAMPGAARMSAATMMSSSALSTASTRKMVYTPSTKSLVLLPATTYTPGSVRTIVAGTSGRFDISSLKPPPSMNNLASGRHRRDSSMASSATVQIGLRLSNVEDFVPMTTSQVLDKKVYTIDMAEAESAAATTAATATPSIASSVTMEPAQPRLATMPPQQRPPQPQPQSSLIQLQQQQLMPPPQPQPSPARQQSPREAMPTVGARMSRRGSEELFVAIDASPRRDPVKNARMKTLPPVPRPVGAADLGRDDDDIFGDGAALSPSIYSPQQSPTKTVMSPKLPSPRGVGFVPMSRNNSSAVRSQPLAPPRQPSAASEQEPGKGSYDWI